MGKAGAPFFLFTCRELDFAVIYRGGFRPVVLLLCLTVDLARCPPGRRGSGTYPFTTIADSKYYDAHAGICTD